MKSVSSSEFQPSKHQAAGHDGCLTSESLFIKLTTKQEIDFYTATQVKELTHGGELGSLLSHWMPTFMGTLTQGDVNNGDGILSHSDKQYIVLSNSYYLFKHPSILDIKLGAKLTDDLKTAPDKIERLNKVSQSTTSGSLSFRICGMKVYNGHNSKKPTTEFYQNMNDSSVSVISHEIDSSNHYYLEFNKLYGRSLNKSNIKHGLYLYFNQNHLPQDVIRMLLNQFLKRLQLIYNCLLDYEIRMYSTSLLFIYESELSRWENVNDENYNQLDPLVNENLQDDDEEELHDGKEIDIPSPLSSLQLIDFAHAKYTPGEGYDENIIQGIENLINIFQQLIGE